MRILPSFLAAAFLPLIVPAADQWHGDRDLHLGSGTSLHIVVWKGEKDPKTLMDETVTLGGNGHARLANGKSAKLGYGNITTALASIEEGYRQGENIIGLNITAQITEINKSAIVIVLGDVKNPGHGDFTDGMTLADALARAGGFEKDADVKRVRLFRKGTSTTVDCRDLNNARNTKLQKGDIIRAYPAPLKI